MPYEDSHIITTDWSEYCWEDCV